MVDDASAPQISYSQKHLGAALPVKYKGEQCQNTHQSQGWHTRLNTIKKAQLWELPGTSDAVAGTQQQKIHLARPIYDTRSWFLWFCFSVHMHFFLCVHCFGLPQASPSLSRGGNTRLLKQPHSSHISCEHASRVGAEDGAEKGEKRAQYFHPQRYGFHFLLQPNKASIYCK